MVIVGEIVSYRDLDVWEQARILVKRVYEISGKFPKDEKYALTSQLRRAAISIPSNITEGCGRNHFKDSTQFFFIARGSLYELETQLILASDLDLISAIDLKSIMDHMIRCKKLLNGFINYFQKQANNLQQTTINELLEEYGNDDKK